MSVSNSDSFTQTRDQIIADALMTLGVYRPGDAIQTKDLNICSNWLNKIIKSWDARGIHMWSQIEGTLFLIANQNNYTINSTTVAGNNVVATYITSASTTSLVVTSTAGMTAADNIGIELDNNTRQWTTIVSVDSATNLTITSPITSSASSGNTVYSFTTAASKPLHITSAVCTDKSGTDRPIYIRSMDEYLAIPNKTVTSSSINQMAYRSNRSDGNIFVWPTPDNCYAKIKYMYSRMLYDFDSGTDNPDFPTEWLDCATKALMAVVARVYGKPEDQVVELKKEAEEALLEMQLWDVNSGSIRIVPNVREEE